MSSLSLFLEWFKEYYHDEFPDIPNETKDQFIEEILLNNSEYITKYEVMDFDGCIRCGECCKLQHCSFWDEETKLCTRHDDPISYLCTEYPWGGDAGIAPLLLNCRYQVSFFIFYLDRFFEILSKNREEEDA